MQDDDPFRHVRAMSDRMTSLSARVGHLKRERKSKAQLESEIKAAVSSGGVGAGVGSSSSPVATTYVKLKGKGLRGLDAYAVQTPDDNQWGFILSQADGKWSQSWPGGHDLATEWVAVPRAKVPANVRAEMDWLLEAE